MYERERWGEREGGRHDQHGESGCMRERDGGRDREGGMINMEGVGV